MVKGLDALNVNSFITSVIQNCSVFKNYVLMTKSWVLMARHATSVMMKMRNQILKMVIVLVRLISSQ